MAYCNSACYRFGMDTKAVIGHFGSQRKAADALGLAQPSVANWGEYPPPLRQLQIEALTGGKLRAEPDCDKFRIASTAGRKRRTTPAASSEQAA